MRGFPQLPPADAWRFALQNSETLMSGAVMSPEQIRTLRVERINPPKSLAGAFRGSALESSWFPKNFLDSFLVA
ncbi:MAG: hypothetical protein FWD94_02715 [Treponema sp.]|nr:hypothetical protein [Treponema sp.]